MSDSGASPSPSRQNQAVEQHSATPLLDALISYVRLFGKKPTRDEFVTGLPVEDNDLSIELGKRALRRYGCTVTEHKIRQFRDEHLPACALMTNGSWRIVVRQAPDHYVVLDSVLPEGVRKVPRKTFDAEFGGFVIQALLDIEEIERRHVSASRPGHWFWSHFRGQSGLIRDIIIGSFVANLLAVSVSLFAMQVYDRVIPNQSIETLWVLVAGGMLAVLMEALIKKSRSNLMDVSGKTIELEIGEKLFSRLVGMKLSKRHTTPGSLIYAVREFSSVREFFTAASVGTIADLPFVFIFLLLVYVIAGPVVWVMLLAMVLIVIPSLFAQKTMSRLAEEMQGGAGAQNKLLIEVGYAADAVKSTRAEGFFQRKWEEISHLNAVKTTEQRSLAASLTFWAAGMQQIAYIFTVVAGVYLVFAGEFTIGTIIAVSILSGRIMSPVTQLSGTLARWQQVRSSMQGLEMIIESEQDRPIDRKFSRKEIFDGSVQLEGLDYSYSENSPVALQIQHLSFEAGSKTALLGSNGSGKSTLLKLLSGLYSPSQGKVLVDQLDLAQIDPNDIRRNIGYLPQEVKLFSGTLRDNLTLGYNAPSEDELFAAVEFAGLGKHVRSHPLGLDLEIVDGGEGLSVGQRQSVGLSRLYLQDPRIVLLDEPTASLDQTLEVQLVTKLGKWLDKRTAIISTHRIPVLNIVDKIVVLGNGSVAMHGAKDKILEKLKAPTETKISEQSDAKNQPHVIA